MKPVKNRAGVILNTAVLRASQIEGKRVTCPACGEKTFESWPDGWKAHAAQRCAALESDAPEDRKAEFAKAFEDLMG